MDRRRSRPHELPVTLLAAFTIATLAGGGARLGAQASGAEEEPFVDRVDVEVVNVEVVVFDREGNRIPGLTIDDFELYEDGRPVEITNFYAAVEAKGPAPDGPGLAVDSPDLPPLPADQRLHWVVYVDHRNLTLTARTAALERLREFLAERASRGDLVMLVGYDGGLEVSLASTQDLGAIEAALQAMDRHATGREFQERRRQQVIAQIQRDPTANGVDRAMNALQYVQSYVAQTGNELRRDLQALSSTVARLAGVPGRKVLVYVSEGLPRRPGSDLYTLLEKQFSLSVLQEAGIQPSLLAERERADDVFARVARDANASRVSFLTVDAGRPAKRLQFGGEVQTERNFNLVEPLLELATATGGRSVINTPNIDGALADAAGDFDVYYSLGYQPSHAGDGGYHKLRVDVERPGLRVRHREGYHDKPERERVAERTLASLDLGAGADPLGVRLQFGPPEKEGRKRYHVPLLIQVAADRVTFLPRDGRHEARLRFFVAVRDEEGDVSEVTEIPYPLSLTDAERAAGEGKELGYATKLLVRRGEPTVAVGVWDEISGEQSIVHARLVVPSPAR